MEEFLTHNQLFIVLIVALIVWLGLIIYLFNIDKKIAIIERKIQNMSNNNENKI